MEGWQDCAAWLCEQCGEWIRSSETVNAILVNDAGTDIHVYGQAVQKQRFTRKMIVCTPCRESIERGY